MCQASRAWPWAAGKLPPVVQLAARNSAGRDPSIKPMSASPYKQLEQEFKRLYAFRGALSLLRWDAAVMMPRGSADVRGEQLAALETEHHALLTTPKAARLIERAEAGASQLG